MSQPGSLRNGIRSGRRARILTLGLRHSAASRKWWFAHTRPESYRSSRPRSRAPRRVSLKRRRCVKWIEPILDEPKEPRQPSETTRKVARGLVGGMRTWRRMVAGLGSRLGKLLPNLLPGSEGASSSPLSSNILLALIAIAVPLMVVTAGFVMYSRFGRSIQYDRNMLEAETARTRAISAAEPARERTEWQAVMFHLREGRKSQEYSRTGRVPARSPK